MESIYKLNLFYMQSFCKAFEYRKKNSLFEEKDEKKTNLAITYA